MAIKKLIMSERKIVKMCAKEEENGSNDNVPTKYLEKCVNRLRNTNLRKFQDMCKMHLSFMLDMPNLEDLLNESEKMEAAETRNSAKKSFQLAAKRKAKPFFHNSSGLPLTEEYVGQIYQLVQFLGEPHNICQEGLFRKTGQLSRQNELKARLYANESLELDSGHFSAHDCASVLKSYLGDLKEPLLTEKYYKAQCQVPGLMPENESELSKVARKRKFHKQIKSVQLLVLLLPSLNSAVLQLVLDLLHRVTLESKTKMTAENLGTVFAPNILCPRDISAPELQSVTSDITKCVALMIQHAPKLFQVPVDLARDVANYWKQMEEDPGDRPCSGTSINDTALDGNMTFGIPLARQDSPMAFNTVVQFVDREASQKASLETDTETALAELYAHVQAMPDSSRKRRLMKQFNKTNGGVTTPGAEGGYSTFFTTRSKTKSIYGSIRKRFCKSAKKENLVNQSLNVSKENILSGQLDEEDYYLFVDSDEGIPLTPKPDKMESKITERNVVEKENAKVDIVAIENVESVDEAEMAEPDLKNCEIVEADVKATEIVKSEIVKTAENEAPKSELVKPTTVLTPITAMFAKKKVAKVDRTLTDSPAGRKTPKKSLIFLDDKKTTTCTEGMVCIVDMNQTAPSVLSPQKRKKDDDTLTQSGKKPCPEPKAARRIEALLSPIPHRASVTKQLTPKSLHPPTRAPLAVFQSPEFRECDRRHDKDF